MMYYRQDTLVVGKLCFVTVLYKFVSCSGSIKHCIDNASHR